MRFASYATRPASNRANGHETRSPIAKTNIGRGVCGGAATYISRCIAPSHQFDLPAIRPSASVSVPVGRGGNQTYRPPTGASSWATQLRQTRSVSTGRLPARPLDGAPSPPSGKPRNAASTTIAASKGSWFLFSRSRRARVTRASSAFSPRRPLAGRDRARPRSPHQAGRRIASAYPGGRDRPPHLREPRSGSRLGHNRKLDADGHHHADRGERRAGSRDRPLAGIGEAAFPQQHDQRRQRHHAQPD